MNKHFIKILFTILIVQVNNSLILAQQKQQMLMFQIDGSNYTKKNYDRLGKLTSTQIFNIEKIYKAKEIYTMNIKIYSYDKGNKLKDSSQTKYTCKPSAREIFMNVFPFSDFSSNKTVKIELNNGSVLYPVNWQIDKKIDDISFSLSIDGGVLGAINTSSKVKIYNRKITSQDTLNNTFTITANIKVKAYSFGFLVDTIDYYIEETIHPQKGIVKQYVKEPTGEYFIIKLNNF